MLEFLKTAKIHTYRKTSEIRVRSSKYNNHWYRDLCLNKQTYRLK